MVRILKNPKPTEKYDPDPKKIIPDPQHRDQGSHIPVKTVFVVFDF